MSLLDILSRYERLCKRLSTGADTIYLDGGEILSIHQSVMDRFGDGERADISDQAAFGYLLEVPNITESQPYGVYQIAVEYLARCAGGKPFAAGNTLTGVILALEFLSQNGVEWKGDIILLECLARRFESDPDMEVFFGLELFLKATHG